MAIGGQELINNLLTYNQDEAPASGDTINVSDGKPVVTLRITPAAAIATLTINLPANNLLDGQVVYITTAEAIAAVTLANGTIISAITVLALGGHAAYSYKLSVDKWYRLI